MAKNRRWAGALALVALGWTWACGSSTSGLSPTCADLAVCCVTITDPNTGSLCDQIAEADDVVNCASTEASLCAHGSGSTFDTSDGGGGTIIFGDSGHSGFADVGLVDGPGGGGARDGGGVTFHDGGGGGFGDSGGGGGFVDTGVGGNCAAPGQSCTTDDDCCDSLYGCTGGTCACGTAGYECGPGPACCPGFECVDVNGGTDQECQSTSCAEVNEPCTTTSDCCADAYLCSEAPDGGFGNVCWATQ